ncbi:PREDICTED: chymotrypsin-1-like isoform X2 [Ceratosolen solmsi marchali]|uniref:Chymotrypsin-1-like isoform X2 n=1 Tax=Ceratosolen solmsi marchali TaxID=326594 RepID=A0AAJ6YUV7_9HYME|nr:PREDICTED: chymotrypsin-1-like isoform X2 [Ceratosolen solmsi marchali]
MRLKRKKKIFTFGRNARIIGGQVADIRQFPHSVSFKLIKNGNHFCGGSIITKLHVLTAAHCLSKYNYKNIRIYTGTEEYKITNRSSFTIESYKIHPMFTGELKEYSVLHHDIAIVTLNNCIEANEYQNYVRLPSKNPQADSIGLISGWGSTINDAKQHPEILQKATFTILSNYKCSSMLPFSIHNEQLCAFAGEGIGACFGDSGVGLINNGEIVGVASFVRPCAVGKPDIYTRVYSYIDFITAAINNTEYVPKLDNKCSIQ